jgi:hypothetical protein
VDADVARVEGERAVGVAPLGRLLGHLRVLDDRVPAVERREDAHLFVRPGLAAHL